MLITINKECCNVIECNVAMSCNSNVIEGSFGVGTRDPKPLRA